MPHRKHHLSFEDALVLIRFAVAAGTALCLLACSAVGTSGSSGAAGFVPISAAPTPVPVDLSPPQASRAVGKPKFSSNSSMVRQIAAGKIEGVDDSTASGVFFWKGVPFAEAPVGPLRWRAPVARRPWRNTRAADKFSEACLQIGRLYGPGQNNTFDDSISTSLGKPVGVEDCLYLNIWRPATDEKTLPVIVYIHGGSNVTGYTADPMYNGAKLAKAANAVVITVNYRLGVLGFLNVRQLRPGGAEGDDSGNFALLDILAALRFVQANVTTFGGDPRNVTLSGESAGAINLLALMTSPKSTGLFHKAIALSGGISLAKNLPFWAVPALKPASASAEQGEKLLANLLVGDGSFNSVGAARRHIASRTNAQVADYLRGIDPEVILSVAVSKGLDGVSPIPDGQVIPSDPIAAIREGAYQKVPLLVGNTRDEGKFFGGLLSLLGGPSGWKLDDRSRFALMTGFDPDAGTSLKSADIIDAAYLPVSRPIIGYNAATRLLTKVAYESNTKNLLDAMKLHQSNLWLQRFDWAQEPYPWNEVYGAAHSFELGFIFGNFGPSVFASVSYSDANRPGRIALAHAMQSSINAFVRSGDPNNSTLGATWKPWPSKLVFDATLDAAAITAQ